MSMPDRIKQYINEINSLYCSGKANEHTYRPPLINLINDIFIDIEAKNELKRVESKNKPDVFLIKDNIEVVFIETKNIGDKDLEGQNKNINKTQFDKYKKEDLLFIFTDYLDFHFYEGISFKKRIRIAKIENAKIKGIPANYKYFKDSIELFCKKETFTIKSAKVLAERMALHARSLEYSLENALLDNIDDNDLKHQFKVFKEVLIHDLKEKDFADVYAQTIAYGLFVARLMKNDSEIFSRQNAIELIPKSNKFLRFLLSSIAGANIDKRIEPDVDSLVNMFRYTDVNKILNEFGKSTNQNDPIIHFYETFLQSYDSGLRKDRGVWYTPEPVVKFIVKAVDDILKTEFEIENGLADNSMINVNFKTQEFDSRFKDNVRKVNRKVHKVQILDPACGTGTFLAEIVKLIYFKKSGDLGGWSSYVQDELIPRLNGFEILMAPYTMAHLKLSLLLSNTNFTFNDHNRFNIYLTNSLEEHIEELENLFSRSLSDEANRANIIKRDTPVMCVIGNPPYSGASQNKDIAWINDLMEDYKKEPGENNKLKEKNSKVIGADEYKFIRYAQSFIEKNNSGIIAFINPHGYLDNPIFRGMRWHLLKTFDKIYILDLHGNSIKNEVCPDGSEDENVFDIKQGVAINIFVKTGNKRENELGTVFHYDLWGKRKYENGNGKYNFLNTKTLKDIQFEKFIPFTHDFGKYYLFKNISKDNLDTYNKGININELFIHKVSGISTAFDELSLHDSEEDAIIKLQDLKDMTPDNFVKQYNYNNKKLSKIENAKKDVTENETKIISLNYRAFIDKYAIYTKTTSGIMDRPRPDEMSHMLYSNYGLATLRTQVNSSIPNTYFITENPIDKNFYGFNSYLFPLYIYNEDLGNQTTTELIIRNPNLNDEIINKISKKLNLTFHKDHEHLTATNPQSYYTPLDLLDYIYSILYSIKYRELFIEFLKIDFPRVPYPKDKDTFWDLIKLGREIREIQTLKNIDIVDCGVIFEGNIANQTEDCIITRSIGKKDWSVTDEGFVKVYINNIQYFDNIPIKAWDFSIGGDKPVQQWLKNKKKQGKPLSSDDRDQFRKIVYSLNETHRLMSEVDKIDFIN